MSHTARPEGKALARQATGLLVANVFRNAGFVAVLILLAQLTNPDTVGRYALALAITMPVFVLAQMSLKNLYLTNHATHRFQSYHALQAFSLAIALPVSLLLGLIMSPASWLTVILVALIKVNDVLCELYSGPLQEYRRTGLIVRSYAVQAIVGTGVVTAVLFATRDMNLALAALVVVSFALTAALMLLPGLRTVREHESGAIAPMPLRADMWALAKRGLPAGAGLAIFTLVLAVPQYFLAAWRGDAAVAYFATVLYALAVVDLFLNAVTQAWIPAARHEFWNRVREHKSFAPFVAKSFGVWTLIFVPVTLAGLVILFFALPVVFGADYRLTIPVGIALGVAIVVSPSQHFVSVGMTVVNFYNRSLIPNLVAAALTTGVCLIAIPTLGNAGAFWAIAAGLITKAVVGLWLMRGTAVAKTAASAG